MTDAEKEERGALWLTHLPAGKEARGKVAAFLLRLSKNSAQDQAKMEAAIGKLPFVISSSAPSGAARRVMAELEKLGAKAQFLPGAGRQASSPPDLPKDEIKKPSPWRKISRLRAATALAVMAILGAAGYQALVNRQKPQNPKPAAKTAALAKPAPVPGRTVAELLAEYEAAHAPMFDRRMADGLAEALHEYVRMFQTGADPEELEVTYSSGKKDQNSFTLRYLIRGKGLDLSVETALTTAPERVGENIPALAAALKDAAGKMAPLAHPPAELKTVKGPAQRAALRAMEKLDMAAVFGAMKEMDKAHTTNQVDPYAPLEAGNLLSWMAYIKSANRRQAVADLLAAHAVANHLVASLFMAQDNPELMMGRALALLGLGYPAAAMQAVAGRPGVAAEWMAVAAKRDMTAAGQEAREDPVYKRLGAYLGVRLAMETGWFGDSAPKILALIKKDPDFILAVEYAVNMAGPGLGGAVMIYAEETGQTAIQTAKDNLSPMPLDGVMAYDDAPGMGPDNAAAMAIIHAKAALGSAFRLNQEERLLTRRLVAGYLDETLQDAALLCSWAEGSLAGSHNTALTFLSLMERQWPGSSSAALAGLVSRMASGQYSQGLEAAEKVDPGAADMDLLEELAWFYAQKPEINAARANKTLDAIRARSLPSPASALRLEETFRRLGRNPESEQAVRRALIMDPYNSQAYAHAAHLPDADTLFRSGELLLGGSARFLAEAGDRARKSGKREEALAYYRRAGLITSSAAAVEATARLHMDAGEHAQAEAVLRKYLEGRGESADALEGTSLLAAAMLAQGKADGVKQLTKDLKETGHPGAIRSFALAAEKLGAPVEAEMFLRKAAEEHRTGRAPVDLAMFHLRNGGRRAAVEDLRSYARHNNPGYYFKEAVEQFKASGNPGGVLAFAAEVENGKLDTEQAAELWKTLMEAGEYKTAATWARSIMVGPQKERSPAFAGRYVEAAAKADPQGARAALAEAVNAIGNRENGIRDLALWLLTRGLSREAFSTVEMAPTGQAGLEAVLAAAWLAGGAFPEGSAVLKNRLVSQGPDQWEKMILQYSLGELGEDALASQGAAGGKLGEALCLIGLGRHAKGDREGAGKLLVMAMDNAGDDLAWRGLAMAVVHGWAGEG